MKDRFSLCFSIKQMHENQHLPQLLIDSRKSRFLSSVVLDNPHPLRLGAFTRANSLRGVNLCRNCRCCYLLILKPWELILVFRCKVVVSLPIKEATIWSYNFTLMICTCSICQISVLLRDLPFKQNTPRFIKCKIYRTFSI